VLLLGGFRTKQLTVFRLRQGYGGQVSFQFTAFPAVSALMALLALSAL
jgi:hypothetical protein